MLPTDRHHSIGTPTFVVWSSTVRFGMSYGRFAAPSTDVGSIPSFTIAASNGVPPRIDCPTMRCSQATIAPLASRPARRRWT